MIPSQGPYRRWPVDLSHIDVSLSLSNQKTYLTSGQDGGIGRYTFPPCTTKKRTTNLKTNSNQNCQKIKLYGSPATKDLKKKHSFRLVAEAEMGSWGREDMDKEAGGPGSPIFACR